MRRLALALPFLLPLAACDEVADAAPADPTEDPELVGTGDDPSEPSDCAPVIALGCGANFAADTSDPNDGATTVLATYPGVVGRYDGAEIVIAFETDSAADVAIALVDPRPLWVDHDLLLLADDDGVCAAANTLQRGFHALEFAAEAGALYYVVVDGYNSDAGPFELTVTCDAAAPPAPSPACLSFVSSQQESAPVQTAGAGLPPGASARTWQRPTSFTSWVDFQGVPGQAATHEGIDWIHADATVPVVDVHAASDGVVAYVRRGCPESARFGHNTASRECGAGWGNHVVIDHGDGIMTRYAHLDHADVAVEVGQAVVAGERIAGMGNSGRSETRHLHFELGVRAAPFDPCAPTQSFDTVHAPRLLGL
jgi:murein DD-endopeptidase MepM/ murein hydrolase activator NlpD